MITYYKNTYVSNILFSIPQEKYSMTQINKLVVAVSSKK